MINEPTDNGVHIKNAKVANLMTRSQTFPFGFYLILQNTRNVQLFLSLLHFICCSFPPPSTRLDSTTLC